MLQGKRIYVEDAWAAFYAEVVNPDNEDLDEDLVQLQKMIFMSGVIAGTSNENDANFIICLQAQMSRKDCVKALTGDPEPEEPEEVEAEPCEVCYSRTCNGECMGDGLMGG